MAIDATTNNLAGPFPSNDSLVRGVRHLGFKDIGNAASVCKAWNEAMKYHDIWFDLFLNEGIPLVDQLDESRYHEAFKVLYPITLSGKIIAELFGRIDGSIPRLQLKCYNQLVERIDPWAWVNQREPEKKMHQTFQLVVDPHSVIRPYDKALYDLLSQDGDTPTLLPDETNPTEMRIPFGLKNRKVLIDHLYAQHKNGPVFSRYFYDQVLVQCNHPLKEVTLHLMRKEVVHRNETYPEQKRHVEEKGFKVAPLRVRLLFNATQIIKFRTCPDAKTPRLTYARTSDVTYARTSDVVNDGERDYSVAIGGFGPSAGVDVCYGCDDARFGDGVLPGLPAEVRPSAIG